MVTFDGAVVKEQGQAFAVVVVKPEAVYNRSKAQQAAEAYGRFFPGMPIVLMTQDSRGVPTYLGRPDLARFLSKLEMSQIPWQQLTFED